MSLTRSACAEGSSQLCRLCICLMHQALSQQLLLSHSYSWINHILQDIEGFLPQQRQNLLSTLFSAHRQLQ